MRLAFGIAAVLALGVLAFWLVYVRAPSPEQVCRHIMDVTLREAGEIALAPQSRETLVDRLEQDCLAHKRDKIKLRGKIVYAHYARCVVAAQTLRQLEDC